MLGVQRRTRATGVFARPLPRTAGAVDGFGSWLSSRDPPAISAFAADPHAGSNGAPPGALRPRLTRRRGSGITEPRFMLPERVPPAPAPVKVPGPWCFCAGHVQLPWRICTNDETPEPKPGRLWHRSRSRRPPSSELDVLGGESSKRDCSRQSRILCRLPDRERRRSGEVRSAGSEPTEPQWAAPGGSALPAPPSREKRPRVLRQRTTTALSSCSQSPRALPPPAPPPAPRSGPQPPLRLAPVPSRAVGSPR